jgi:glutathione S-transferase
LLRLFSPLDERFEHNDAFWQRWQRRPTFMAAYADRSSGAGTG